jgi:hypothetical protein
MSDSARDVAAIRVFIRVFLCLLLGITVAASGVAALYGLAMILLNINDASADKWAWMAMFGACVAIGATLTWVAAKALLCVWRN